MAFAYPYTSQFTSKKKAVAWADSFLHCEYEIKTTRYGDAPDGSRRHTIMLDYEWLDADQLREEGWNIT